MSIELSKDIKTLLQLEKADNTKRLEAFEKLERGLNAKKNRYV